MLKGYLQPASMIKDAAVDHSETFRSDIGTFTPDSGWS